MVKQTKTFKKGNVTKKALSAILAASMVMTSSSFVMAAPVEVEDVAVEAAAVAEDAAVVDVVEDVEENVGVIAQANVTVEDAVYTGEKVIPKVTVVADGQTLTENVDYTVDVSNNINVTKNAVATITFIGDYDGTADQTKEFEIKPLVLTSANAKITNAVEGYVYNGQKQTLPIPIVSGIGADAAAVSKAIAAASTGGFKFEAYSDSYDLKSVGPQKAKLVSVSGNIEVDSSLGTYDFTIEQAPFEDAKVDVTVAKALYTGKPVAADVTVKYTGTNEVVDPSTYSIQYYDENDKLAGGPQTNVGTYNIALISNGKGNFKAGTLLQDKSQDLTYSIEVGAFSDIVAGATIAGTVKENGDYNLTYNGKDQVISPSDLVIPGLTQGVDYEVDFSEAHAENAEEDAILLTVKGKNQYATASDETLHINIKPMVINTKDFTITAKANKLTTPGATPTATDMTVTIKKGDLELKYDKDFVIGDINAAKRTVQIKGSVEATPIKTPANYTTTDAKRDGNDYITVSYTQATKKLIEKLTFASIADKTWTGKQITPTPEITDGSYTLKNGVDYTVSYGTNVDSGKKAGKVIVTGIGDYEGTHELLFNITGTAIDSKFKVEAGNVSEDAAKAGNGKSTPIVSFINGASAPSDFTFTTKYYRLSGTISGSVVTEANKGAELTDAAFKTLKKDDTVVVEVTGTGKYSGAIYGSYEIVEAEDIATKIDVTPIADQQYTGNAIEPTVIVTSKAAGEVYTKDKDYKVSYMYNTQVGTAYVVVTGIGAYAGEVVTPFKIVGEMPQEIVVLAAQERDLGNGTRTLNSKATKIKYTTAPETAVTYTSSDENVVTVDAEGNLKYTGLGEATITIEAKAENGYKAAKKEIKVVVKLAKPSFTPFSKNNAFTLTSSTVKGAEKFEVQYATKKNFSNAKTKTFTTTTAGKIRQVKVAAADKRTYYVRVRAVSGTTKSAWSGVKTVATK